MELFKILSNRTEFVKNNIDLFILAAVEDTKQQLEDIQRDQLTIGQNADGKDLGVLKRDSKGKISAYAKRKKAKGGQARLGIADLKNTGELYNDIFAKVENKLIEINSTASYTKYNEDRYGEQISGLNEDSREAYLLVLVPVVVDKLKKYYHDGTKP